MTRPRYRHIIWDWNGTLLDDLDYTIGVMNGILGARGLQLLDRTRCRALFDFPVRKYYERLGFDAVRDSFERVSEEFISNYNARRLECRLHSAVPTLLPAIRSNGLGQSILSAYPHATLVQIVEHHGIAQHFTHISGLGDIHAHGKIELGRALLARLDVPPGEILLVGDTVHDHEVAIALGAKSALVTTGNHSVERLRACTEDVFDSLEELAAKFGLTADS